MSDQRKDGIAWTDATWNPLRGCSKVSSGCKNCYAETMAARFAGPGQPYEGTIDRGRWNGRIRLVPEKLGEPLRWRRPRRVFVNSMSDLFHEDVPFEYIAAVFGVMAACPQHTFQVLTKRPERAVQFFEWAQGNGVYRWHMPNVHLGVSVEDQATADERIPHLLACPAAIRFVSCEPMLAGVDFGVYLRDHACDEWPKEISKGPESCVAHPMPALDWIVIGGESGPHARPFDVAWAYDTVRQCRAAGVACFVKQMGARPRVAEASRLAALWAAMPGGRVDDCGGIHLRDRAGADPAEWPEDLRVREWPAAKEGEK